ncbi:MAG TPA: hypothetical protein VIT24_08065, partial [Acidimicrobiales bacterium]
MPWLFLIAALIGFWFTLNAFRPVRRNTLFFGQSFFAGWLTTELAGHHLVWQFAMTVVFVATGALDAWPGWVALAVTLVSWTGLVILVVQGHRAARQVDDALGHLLAGDPPPGIPWSYLVLPFRMKRKGVDRDRDIEFARAGGRVLRLDVYRPSAPLADGKRRPAVLQIHGGGWVVGDKREQG